MKRILWYLAGLVSGVVGMFVWLIHKDRTLRVFMDREWKHNMGKAVADLNKDMRKVIRRVEELRTADADLPKYYFGTPIEPLPSTWESIDSLADTQEIKVKP
jgi:hypothetical protein